MPCASTTSCSPRTSRTRCRATAGGRARPTSWSPASTTSASSRWRTVPRRDRFLDWWCERLLTDCRIAQHRGLFVDQRWVDFVPGLFANLAILRDPAYNVAYWNLPSRDLRWDAELGYTVDGRPLRFFHFSGYNPAKPHELSKYQDRIRLPENPALQHLCDDYGRQLMASGSEDFRELPYEHDVLPSGLRLTPRLRDIYREGLEAGDAPTTIFTPAGETAFLAWLNAPSPDAPLVTRFMYGAWRERPDVQRAYPELDDPAVVHGFLGWCHVFGRTEVPIPDQLMPAERGAAGDDTRAPEPGTGGRPPGKRGGLARRLVQGRGRS